MSVRPIHKMVLVSFLAACGLLGTKASGKAHTEEGGDCCCCSQTSTEGTCMLPASASACLAVYERLIFGVPDCALVNSLVGRKSTTCNEEDWAREDPAPRLSSRCTRWACTKHSWLIVKHPRPEFCSTRAELKNDWLVFLVYVLYRLTFHGLHVLRKHRSMPPVSGAPFWTRASFATCKES